MAADTINRSHFRSWPCVTAWRSQQRRTAQCPAVQRYRQQRPLGEWPQPWPRPRRRAQTAQMQRPRARLGRIGAAPPTARARPPPRARLPRRGGEHCSSRGRDGVEEAGWGGSAETGSVTQHRRVRSDSAPVEQGDSHELLVARVVRVIAADVEQRAVHVQVRPAERERAGEGRGRAQSRAHDACTAANTARRSTR